MSDQSSPHDAVFRRFLSDPVNAASQLSSVLPAGLVDRLDLERLALMPGSFVDSSLRSKYSDLLFTAPLDGREAFVYVLVEHQSSPDPLMPYRMLGYMVRIWDAYLRDNRGATRLPVVIPLVVHHSRRNWTAPTELRDLFDVDPDLAGVMEEFLPQFRFLLDDLSIIDPEALRARPLTPQARITLLLLIIAPTNEHLADDLDAWFDDLHAIADRADGREALTGFLKYIGLVGETPPDELHDLVRRLGPTAEEAYMTTAEMLRAEGEARGEARGRAEALVQILTFKFGQPAQRYLDRINTASSDQLESWTARVLTANTPDEALH